MRKILISWWSRGENVRVEVEGPTKFLKVRGKVVVTVSVVDGQLHSDWDEEWKGWEDFHKSEEIIGLLEKMKNFISGGVREREKEKKEKIKVLRDSTGRVKFHLQVESHHLGILQYCMLCVKTLG